MWQAWKLLKKNFKNSDPISPLLLNRRQLKPNNIV